MVLVFRPMRRTKRRAKSPPPKATLLAAYLAAGDISQTAFAAECARLTGLRVNPRVVSRWARGDVTPNQHSRVLIARATAGAVPVESWGRA
jgi:hypothetical protein